MYVYQQLHNNGRGLELVVLEVVRPKPDSPVL